MKNETSRCMFLAASVQACVVVQVSAEKNGSCSRNSSRFVFSVLGAFIPRHSLRITIRCSNLTRALLSPSTMSAVLYYMMCYIGRSSKEMHERFWWVRYRNIHLIWTTQVDSMRNICHVFLMCWNSFSKDPESFQTVYRFSIHCHPGLLLMSISAFFAQRVFVRRLAREGRWIRSRETLDMQAILRRVASVASSSYKLFWFHQLGFFLLLMWKYNH